MKRKKIVFVAIGIILSLVIFFVLNTVTTVGKSCNPSLPRNFPFLHNCEIVHLGIYIVGNPLLECRYPKDSGRSLGGSGTCQYK